MAEKESRPLLLSALALGRFVVKADSFEPTPAPVVHLVPMRIGMSDVMVRLAFQKTEALRAGDT
jgi:hypothetical protein